MGEAKRKKKAQTPPLCEFCGMPGHTREHIWSDWINRNGVLHFDGWGHVQNQTHALIKPLENVAYITQEPPKTRQGSMTLRTVNIPCEQCNGGWMKGIVDNARSAAESLVVGKSIELGIATQQALAAWIALATIVSEYTSERTRVISQEDREFMYNNHTPPPRWSIFIGHYLGPVRTPFGYRHHGAPLQSFVLPRPGVPGTIRNDYFQMTTYTLGQFLTHAFNSNDDELAEFYRKLVSHRGLRRIWPTIGPLSWPTKPPLEAADDFESVADGYLKPLFSFINCEG